MPPASTFRPVSQSGTAAFRYWAGSPYSGTRLVQVSAFLFILVPDWLDAGQTDPAFKKGVHPTGPYCWLWKWIHPARPYCFWWKGIHPAGPLTAADGDLFLLYDIEKLYINARIPECRIKLSQASAFLPVISCFSLASAFRHQGSVRYRWLQISPALPRYGIEGAPFYRLFTAFRDFSNWQIVISLLRVRISLSSLSISVSVSIVSAP
jgi:hypothetical protein